MPGLFPNVPKPGKLMPGLFPNVPKPGDFPNKPGSGLFPNVPQPGDFPNKPGGIPDIFPGWLPGLKPDKPQINPDFKPNKPGEPLPEVPLPQIPGGGIPGGIVPGAPGPRPGSFADRYRIGGGDWIDIRAGNPGPGIAPQDPVQPGSGSDPGILPMQAVPAGVQNATFLPGGSQ